MHNENSLNTIGTNLVQSSTVMSTNLYSKLYSNTDSNNEDDSDSDEEYIKAVSAMNVTNNNGSVQKCQNTNSNDECDYGYNDDIENNRLDGECHHHVRRNSCLINKEKNVLTTIVERTSILGFGSDCLLTLEMEGLPRMSDRDLKHDQKRKADIVIALYNQ